MSPDTNPSPAASTVPPAGPGPVPASASAPAPAGAPGTVTVMCPTGFTKSSLVGMDPQKLLYARVTYRPA